MIKKKGWYDWHQISRIFDNELSFRDLTSCYNAATLKNDIFVKTKKSFYYRNATAFFEEMITYLGLMYFFPNRQGMGI